jgi:hypothetical protein
MPGRGTRRTGTDTSHGCDHAPGRTCRMR